MFRIESWTAGQGWREHYRVPQDIDEAKSMLQGLRHSSPDKQWRAVQVLEF